jgi:hypothetical protein
MKKPLALLTVTLLAMASLAFAPGVSAAPPNPNPYKPDKPALCVRSNESKPTSGGQTNGTYDCSNGVWTKCNNVQYATPCRYCDSYRYSNNATASSSEYKGCTDIPAVQLNHGLPEGRPPL